MTSRKNSPAARLGQTALAGATLLGAPLPLRHAAAQTTGQPQGRPAAADLRAAGADRPGLPARRRRRQRGVRRHEDAGEARHRELRHRDPSPTWRAPRPRRRSTPARRCWSAPSTPARPPPSPRSPSSAACRFVVNIAAAPQITEQGYKFVFRNFPTAPMLINGALALHKEIFKVSGKTPKTAVFMHVNDTFGTVDGQGHQGAVSQARHALQDRRHHHLRSGGQGPVGRGRPRPRRPRPSC